MIVDRLVFYTCITNDYKLSGLKQHPLISSQVYRSEVQAGLAGSSAKALTKLKLWCWAVSYLETLGKSASKLTEVVGNYGSEVPGPHYLQCQQWHIKSSYALNLSDFFFFSFATSWRNFLLLKGWCDFHVLHLDISFLPYNVTTRVVISHCIHRFHPHSKEVILRILPITFAKVVETQSVMLFHRKRISGSKKSLIRLLTNLISPASLDHLQWWLVPLIPTSWVLLSESEITLLPIRVHISLLCSVICVLSIFWRCVDFFCLKFISSVVVLMCFCLLRFELMYPTKLPMLKLNPQSDSIKRCGPWEMMKLWGFCSDKRVSLKGWSGGVCPFLPFLPPCGKYRLGSRKWACPREWICWCLCLGLPDFQNGEK